MIELVSPRFGEESSACATQVEWLNDKALMRYSEQRHKVHTLESQVAYIQDFLNHPDNIFREIHHGSKLVGTITAYVDMKNRVADVGILIGPDHSKKEYGYQAWYMLCETLFENLNLRRIEAGCMALNIPMVKIMRRYGMAEEGRRMSHFMVDGTYSDLVLYGRFR